MGTMIFQRVSDAIRFILSSKGVAVSNYIDNIFTATETSSGKDSLKVICDTITELGLPLNEDKVQRPCDTPSWALR